MTNKTSCHLVDRLFISENSYKLLNTSHYLALKIEIHADFSMWIFKGYGNRQEVYVALYRM